MMYSYKSMGSIPLPLIIHTGTADKFDIECTKVVRYLPKRRLVCIGSYKGEDVIAKVFFGKRYKKRWQRELTGINLISDTRINTPSVLEQFLDKDEGFAVIVFQYISEAETLEERWTKSNDENIKQKVFSCATDLLATMHDAGVFQRDIHLSNFITKGGKVYLIDGEQVYKKTGKKQLVKACEQNLSMFFTQMYQYELPYIKQLFTSYLKTRRKKNWLPGYDQTMRQLECNRKWRVKKYVDNKVFRSCTEFETIVDKKMSVFIRRDIDSGDVRRFVDNPGLYIDKGEVIKNGTSTKVVKIRLNNCFFILKYYKNKGLTHSLFSCLKKYSRAASSWRHGHLLKFLGIPTADPVVCMDKKLWGMAGDSLIVTKHLDGLQLQKYLLNEQVNEQSKKQVVCKVKLRIKQMHESMIAHGDLKLPNILISDEEPFFVDLDSMCKASREKIQKDRERFVKSASEMNVSKYFNSDELSNWWD